MIIIKSQDGIRILKVKFIFLDAINPPETIILASDINIDNAILLGTYKTKERAQEVLDEIFKEIKCRAYTPTYEMPKE